MLSRYCLCSVYAVATCPDPGGTGGPLQVRLTLTLTLKAARAQVGVTVGPPAGPILTWLQGVIGGVDVQVGEAAVAIQELNAIVLVAQLDLAFAI